MPYGAWLKGPLREIMEDTLNPGRVSSRGLFKVDVVENVRRQFYHENGNWALPWLLMMIELWFRQVVDSSSS
jgi:asparagine synthase (glutamine-hydrolysing)